MGGGGGNTGRHNLQKLTEPSVPLWHACISWAQPAPRPRQAEVGSPSRHKPQDWLLKLYSLQNLYQRHGSVLGWGVALTSRATLMFPPPQVGQTRLPPPQQRDAGWRPKPDQGGESWASECSPQMERFGPLQWRIKVYSSSFPSPWKRVGGGLRGSLGDGEASSRLSIWLQGAGTEAKRGPSVTSSPASSLEQAGLGRGKGGTAVWPRSSQAKTGIGATLGGGNWGGFFFFRFLIFFSTS